MSNCIDPNYVELIARNAILKMLADHTLQAGLRDCACGWIGHETRVVTCDSLSGLVQDLIDEGEVSPSAYRVTDFSWNGTDGELTLATTDQTWTVNLSELMNAARVVNMDVNSAGTLVLTFSDGSTLEADLVPVIRGEIEDWANETWPCGPFTEVEHDGSLSGNGTSCNPLSVSADGIAFSAADGPAPSEEDSLPTVMYGPRTAVLGAPSGWINIGGMRVPHYGAV